MTPVPVPLAPSAAAAGAAGTSCPAETFAVLNFFTRGYNRYFRPFYETAKRHFFPRHRKVFFIFSDNQYIDEPDIVRIPIANGHPDIRIQYLAEITDIIRAFDHVMLINGNALFLENIDEGVHPEDGVFLSPLYGSTIGMGHLGYFCVETSPESSAFIDRDREDIRIFWRGCLWGGRPEHVVPLIQTLTTRLDEPYESTDERHLNRYFLDHREIVQTLDARYIWPGGWGYNPHRGIRIVLPDKLGRYSELMRQTPAPQAARAFARELNPNGPFYVGPGSWPSDIMDLTGVPPERMVIETVPPSVPCRLRDWCRRQIVPPVLGRCLRSVAGLRRRRIARHQLDAKELWPRRAG